MSLMPILSNSVPIHWNTEIDCEKLATKLGLQLRAHFETNPITHIWLIGDLGTGKTTFVRYLLRSFGFMGKVKSPTYNLCEPYQISIDNRLHDFHHFDLYRMNSPTEWEDAGFKDILTNPGVCLIEWPEIAQGTLPNPDMILQISYESESSRTLIISAGSNHGQTILESISTLSK
jgi:tRNA threonylcarbamoyladenosine biosynthesis protein TsaE